MFRSVKRSMASLSQKIDHKRAIKEFYKNVHPDTIQTAPKRVKEENMRSLSILNDYLDKIKKNEGSTPVKVRFYAPEKDNSKSKRYYFFETQLDGFTPNSASDVVDLLEKRTITKLVSNLKATQYYNNPLQAKTESKGSSNEIIETAEDHLKNNPGLLAKSTTKRELYSDLAKFKQELSNYENNRQKSEIMKGIQKNLYVFYDELPFKDYYGEEIFKDLTFNVLERKLKEKEIELKIYYVSDELDQQLVFSFFKRLSKALKVEDFKRRYQSLQLRIEVEDPRIKLLLSKEYKISKGFICIDVGAQIDQTVEFIEENLQTALDDREDHIANHDHLDEEVKKVVKSCKLNSIDFSNYDAESNQDIEMTHTKKFIFLKKLMKLRKSVGDSLKDYQVNLSSANHVDVNMKMLRLKWNFDEKEAMTFLNA